MLCRETKNGLLIDNAEGNVALPLSASLVTLMQFSWTEKKKGTRLSAVST